MRSARWTDRSRHPHPAFFTVISCGWNAGAPGHAQTCELVGNIVNMSRILKVKTVAECVETEDQVTVLEQLGCGIYQGYYYSRPIPLEDLIEYVKHI